MVEGYQYSLEEGNGMDVSKEGIKNKKGTADWNRGVDIRNGNEKSQVNLIATLVEKIMKDYRKDSNEPKVGIRCNFYNHGFCRQGSSCEFEHPTKLCEQYLNDGECSRRDCNGRHTY